MIESEGGRERGIVVYKCGIMDVHVYFFVIIHVFF